jgi:hypothetical protein
MYEEKNELINGSEIRLTGFILIQMQTPVEGFPKKLNFVL